MEYIDIYDENRQLTGEKLDRNTPLKKGQYMLYVLALIENEDHQFLFTQRSMTKKWAPGAWEIPGGGAMAGEDSFTAVCREVLEETGLDISACSPTPVYTYLNEDLSSGDNYFCDIYRCQLDFHSEDVEAAAREISNHRMVDIQDLAALHQADKVLHYERICQALGL